MMGKSLSALTVVIRASVLVVVCLILGNMWRTGHQWMQWTQGISAGLQSMVSGEQPDPEVDQRTVILQQIQGVSELTTAVLAMEAVVPTHQDRTLGSYVIGTTRLLYIAHGEVRAGIDLSQLSTRDITITGNTLQIQLPPPMILDSKVDVERSQIYDYDRGFLGLGPDAAAELQTLAQRETLSDLSRAACAHQLLEQANERAIATLSQFLEAAHSDSQVVIQTQPPAQDICPTV